MGNVTTKLSEKFKTFRIRKRANINQNQRRSNRTANNEVKIKTQINKQRQSTAAPNSKQIARTPEPSQPTVSDSHRSARINEWLQNVETNHKQPTVENGGLMMMIVYKNRGKEKVRVIPACNTS